MQRRWAAPRLRRHSPVPNDLLAHGPRGPTPTPTHYPHEPNTVVTASAALGCGCGVMPPRGGHTAPRLIGPCRPRQGRRTKARAAATPSAVQALCPDGWPLWTLLLVCGASGQLADARTKWGGMLGAPLVSMLCAVLLSSRGIIPVDTVIYDVVWKYLMPMAAACFLLDTDMALLISTGGTILLSFIVGSFGMVLGAVLGWYLLQAQMGPQGALIAAALCSSYVGGSINFIAISQTLGLSPDFVPVAMAADNLAMALYLAILMAVPVDASSGRSGADASAPPSSGTPASVAGVPPPASDVTAGSVSLSLACAAVSCTLSQPAAVALRLRPLALTIMAVIAIGISSALRAVLREPGASKGHAEPAAASSPFAGATQIGGALMLIFFAVIGASAGGLARAGASAGSMQLAMVLLAFMTIMVAVHWAVLAAAGRLMRMPTQALLLGSNACIGGPATAASMAMSKGWTSMTQTAMLVGSLGYAIGTAAGMAVYTVTRML